MCVSWKGKGMSQQYTMLAVSWTVKTFLRNSDKIACIAHILGRAYSSFICFRRYALSSGCASCSDINNLFPVQRSCCSQKD